MTIRRVPFLSATFLVFALVLTGLAVQASFDAQRQSAPPHAAPADARVAIAPLPLAAVGGEDISAALEPWPRPDRLGVRTHQLTAPRTRGRRIGRTRG